MKRVIYTCITGKYDNIQEPIHVTEGWDYICFTNNPDLKSDKWEIRQLGDTTKFPYEHIDEARIARRVKILPHEYVGEYDLSIWVDANISVACDLDEFASQCLIEGNVLALMTHGQRNCIYAEGAECIKQNKDSEHLIKSQLGRLVNMGYPENEGMVQTGIEIRKHNDEDLIKFNKAWFEEVEHGSKRDQLSFNYIMWVQDFKKVNLFKHDVLFNHKKFPIKMHNHGW